MLLTFITNGKIHTSSLPGEPSGMRWIVDESNPNTKRFGLIEAKDETWVLSPRQGVALIRGDGTEEHSALLGGAKEEAFTFISGEERALLLVQKTTPGDKQTRVIGFKTDEVITVGSAPDNTVDRHFSPVAKSQIISTP